MREDAAIMMSCKKSIKANHYLKKNEMADLIDQLRKRKIHLLVLMVDQLLLTFQIMN